MKLLFGTGNQAKLNVMKIRLKPLEINLIGLEDLKKEGYTVPSVPETGNTPLENARQKAMAYYQVFKMPGFPAILACILMRFQMKFSLEFMFAM